MSEFFPYDRFVDDLGKGVHDFDSDVLKIAFTNTLPSSADLVLADIGEISAGNGYPAGGLTVATTWSTAGNIGHLAAPNIALVSNTGNLGPFRWLVLYNSTIAGGVLIGYWDRSRPVTLDGTIGDPITISIDDDVLFIEVRG